MKRNKLEYTVETLCAEGYWIVWNVFSNKKEAVKYFNELINDKRIKVDSYRISRCQEVRIYPIKKVGNK